MQGGPLQGSLARPLPDRIAAATYAAALACAGGQPPTAPAANYDAFLEFWQGRAWRSAGRRPPSAGRSHARPLRGGQTLSRRRLARLCHRYCAAGRRRAADGSGQANLRQPVCRPLCLCRGLCRHGRGLHSQGAYTLSRRGRPARDRTSPRPILRGGAALLAAALAAAENRLRDPGHIPRGYEDLPGALRGLGGDFLRRRPLTLHHRPVHARPLREPPRYRRIMAAPLLNFFTFLHKVCSFARKIQSLSRPALSKRQGRPYFFMNFSLRY